MIAKAGPSTTPTERLHRQGGIVIADNASTSPRLNRVIAKALTCVDTDRQGSLVNATVLQTLKVPFPCRDTYYSHVATLIEGD